MHGDTKVYSLAAVNGVMATAGAFLPKLETFLRVATSAAQLAVAVVTVIFIIKKIRSKK